MDRAHDRTVDVNALEEILDRRKERERRDRNSIGPSGRQAWDTLETLNPEHQHTIDTKAGKVRFHFRTLPQGSPSGTHLQLFRNGMWITNDVPGNKSSDYRQVMPFSGVVLLDPNEAKDACGLVGTFEGPRHIYIDLTIQKRGSAARRELDEFFRQLHAGILKLVPELESKEYDPGFFSIEVPGDGVRSDPRARVGGVGTPERVRRRDSPVTSRPPRPLPGPEPRPEPRPRKPPRLRRRIEAQVTALKQDGGIHIRANSLEDAPKVELRVVLADGSDETCDSPAPDEYLEMKKGAQVDGQPAKSYVKDKHGVRRALMLGPVSSDGSELDIWIPCKPTQRGDIRIELVRIAARGDRT